MARERLEVALPVRDQPDPKLVCAERLEHGDRIVVEVEVGVNLPAPDDLDRARARALGVAAHAADDVLGERDPDLLVVHELGVHPQVGEGRDPRRLVASGIEAEAVRVPHALIRIGPELGPGPREREVDVEEDGAQHRPSIRAEAASTTAEPGARHDGAG